MTPSQDDPNKNIVDEMAPVTEPTFEQIRQRMEESIREHVPEHPVDGTKGVEPLEAIMQFFAYRHLPAELQQVSRAFCELADRLVVVLPRGPERSVALRKLLESKDAAVRARMTARP
jgi:hypothetical protein